MMTFHGPSRALVKLRRDKLWRWRCQWGVVSLAALALVAYNGAAQVWLLAPCAPPAPCASPTPPPPPSCEPAYEPPSSPGSHPDPLPRLDAQLGRWDNSRAYRLHDNAAVGDEYAALAAAARVTLATQTSLERLGELVQVAEHWTGPISVAVFVAAEELLFLRAFVFWLAHCRSDLFARIAFHVAFPAERPGTPGLNFPRWTCSGTPPVPERTPQTAKWRVRHPYPQNHMRNLARKNCHTPYVFLVDIDIVPSLGMADALERFLAGAEARCALCAFVVPTYELDRRVATFPTNKSELLRLSRYKLAVPFHRKVFIYNQYASNFTRWEASGGNESAHTHVSHNVTNFELLYEPFYVAPDSVPPHDERFLGYGFTRNSQEKGY